MVASRRWPLVPLWLFAGIASAGSRDPETRFFNQSPGDFREELQIARNEGRQGVLLFFEMDDCPFRRRHAAVSLGAPA